MHEKEGDGTVEQRTWQRGEEPGFIDIFKVRMDSSECISLNTDYRRRSRMLQTGLVSSNYFYILMTVESYFTESGSVFENRLMI